MTRTESASAMVRRLLRERRWSQSDLVREAGINKNTVSDFLNDKTEPARSTLRKIEEALGLTPGTLAARGEEPAAAPAAPGDRLLREATPEELLAELGARVVHLRHELELATASDNVVILDSRGSDANQVLHDLGKAEPAFEGQEERAADDAEAHEPIAARRNPQASKDRPQQDGEPDGR